MGKKTKSFLSAVALSGAVLFFGPASSKAHAGHRRYANPNAHRPYYGRVYHGARYRPYRLVRVFVHAPYPRWIYRRVYYAPPAYYAPPVYSAPPGAAYCRPY